MKKNINEDINNLKKLMGLNESLPYSNLLFGGAKVSIPANGAHAGQIGWQSANAWDIPTPIGSPVYAIASGTLLSFNDYGPVPIHTQGKTLFGIGFTVDSDEGLPDVYYTHLKDATVKKGDHVKCGQLLGYVMDFPGSSYDHVHIGVEYGHDIKEFLTNDGQIKCAKGDFSSFSILNNPLMNDIKEFPGKTDEKELLDKILNSEFNGKKIKDLISDEDFFNTIVSMIKFFA
jgi:murein DD-endopeptidase MepM/ murein hydrolase activator NlpD